MPFVLRSASFENNQPIPRVHTGDGEDLSPPLDWSGAPPGTAELVLLVDDPDAPSKQPWVHWIAYHIPATFAGLPAGFHGTMTPPGMAGIRQGKNSWGTAGYRGPAPPKGHGRHRYVFHLMALDKPLDLPADLDRDTLTKRLDKHVIAQARLTGTYER